MTQKWGSIWCQSCISLCPWCCNRCPHFSGRPCWWWSSCILWLSTSPWLEAQWGMARWRLVAGSVHSVLFQLRQPSTSRFSAAFLGCCCHAESTRAKPAQTKRSGKPCSCVAEVSGHFMGSTVDIAQIQASGLNRKVNLQHSRLNPGWPRGMSSQKAVWICLLSGCPKIWDMLDMLFRMRIGAEIDDRRTGDLLELRWTRYS